MQALSVRGSDRGPIIDARLNGMKPEGCDRGWFVDMAGMADRACRPAREFRRTGDCRIFPLHAALVCGKFHIFRAAAKKTMAIALQGREERAIRRIDGDACQPDSRFRTRKAAC